MTDVESLAVLVYGSTKYRGVLAFLQTAGQTM